MVSTRLYTTTIFFLVIAINHFQLVSTAPLERRIIGASKLLQDVKGKLFSGSGTYYKVGSGSCGEHDTDSELVVAMNKAQMDNGKMLRVYASVLLEYLTPAKSRLESKCQPKMRQDGLHHRRQWHGDSQGSGYMSRMCKW